MSRQSVFGNFIHALSTDLHFNPFVLWPKYSDMQTLVAIALRYAEPIAQALGVGLVHVCDDRVDLPTLHLLFL